MQTIEITTTPDGEFTLTVKGVKGKACKDVSAAIEKALGRVTKDTPTAEMNQQAVNTNRLGR